MKKSNVEKEIVEKVLEDFRQRQFERKNFENNWQLNINFFIFSFICK